MPHRLQSRRRQLGCGAGGFTPYDLRDPRARRDGRAQGGHGVSVARRPASSHRSDALLSEVESAGA
jgi:hypothetical protein